MSGKPAPAALNRAMIPLATPRPPTTMPSTVAVTEMISASATIRRRTCFVLGADGAHQRQLTQALADRDAEHVVDDERAHEGGDEGERQQAVAEDRDDRVDVVGRLLGDLLRR